VAYPDGRERWVDFLRVPDFGEDGTVQGYVALSVDITERKRFEAALIAEKDRAEVANRAKSEFLATMSHELRTPLNAIIGFAELMKMEAMGPIGNDVYRQYSRDIALSGNHLLSLINDILDLAKVEAGKIELHEEEVPIAELFEATGRIVRERATVAKLEIEIDDGRALPPIQGDRRKLMQILVNLLSNAIKFTPEGGRVALSGRRDESGDVLLAITDTGIGMAPEELTKAMTPFGQIDSSLSRKYAGTGLGLPLASKLAELHGGAIAIDSTPGRGTTVTVRLPARRVRKRAA
jgi:signal transduction histidine kinase